MARPNLAGTSVDSMMWLAWVMGMCLTPSSPWSKGLENTLDRLCAHLVPRTQDGGRTFQFVSWVVPWDDPWRAAMPAPVRVSESKLVVAVRRRSHTANWIDCYGSSDNGTTWALLSKVGHTDATGNDHNGNPEPEKTDGE